MSKTQAALILTAACLAAGIARAGISYDGISNASPTSLVIQTAAPWQAEDANLDTAFGLALDRVEILSRLSAFSQVTTYTGSVTIGVYTSVPQGGITKPGVLLASFTQTHTWSAGVSDVIGADFPGLNLASPSIWIGWMFASAGGTPLFPGQSVPFVVQSVNAPSVGTTTGATASGNAASGSWSAATGNGEYRSIRVSTVPSPAGGTLMMLGVLAARRRLR